MPGKKSGSGSTKKKIRIKKAVAPRTDSPSDYASEETKRAVARQVEIDRKRREKPKTITPSRVARGAPKQVEVAPRRKGGEDSFLDDPLKALGALLINAPMASGPGAGRRPLSAEKRRQASRDLLKDNWGRDWLLGSHLSEQLESGEFNPLSLLDAALMTIGRPVAGARAGAVGAKALFKEGGKEAVEAAAKEYGGPGLTKRGIRTLKLGEKVQQLPAARSRITKHLIEKPADWTSRQLMREESRAAALVRKVLPTASAEKRVAKGAGRQQVIEASRSQARMLKNINALPKEGSPEDVAHFWWAQLPKSHRNVQGLELVRNAQAKELEELVSAQAIPTRQVPASDIPLRIEDLSASIAELDQVIAKTPRLNPGIIEAVRGLSTDRKNILVEANVLKPERAAGREGLVSRWLGLEPDADEAFIGHRGHKVRGANESLLPASPGAGRVRLPEGVSTENKLSLAKSGRLRPSTYVAVQDWQASQVYKQAVQARDDLGQMGKKFEGRVPEDSVLINPKGRAIPRHWKTDRLAQLSDAEEEEVKKAAEEIVKSFMAEGEDINAFIEEAMAAGVNWDELRVVPKSVVDRYYGQFVPVRGVTRGGRAYDSAVDMTAASIVFARLGYIPKNIAQNLIMSVPHQGPFVLVNIPRAAQALVDPELRHLLSAEVGFSGATHGLSKEFSGLGRKTRGAAAKTAETVGKIADNPLRISAFLHEAASEGVISKLNPILTEADKGRLMELLTDEASHPLLNDIRSRSVEAMADFSRLTPTQRKWARRFLIIPGWLWAGSRYPAHFAATHPIRSAAIGYAAAGEPYADELGLPQNPPITEALAGGLPWYLEGIGGDEGKVLRTTSLSPVSTPWEIAGALAGRDPRTAGSYANPLGAFLWNLANKQAQGPYGTYPLGSYQDAFKRGGERIVPNVTFAKQLISPSGEGRYPEDATRLGRIKRELGVFPVEITREGKPVEEPTWRDKVTKLEELRNMQAGPQIMAAVAAKEEWEKVIGDNPKKPDQTELDREKELAQLKYEMLVRLQPSAESFRAEVEQALEDPTQVSEIDSAIEYRLGYTELDKISAILGDYEKKLALEAKQHSG